MSENLGGLKRGDTKNREDCSQLDGVIQLCPRGAVTVVGRGLTIYLNVTSNTCVRGASSILIH